MRTLLAALAAITLLLAACGGDDDASPTNSAAPTGGSGTTTPAATTPGGPPNRHPVCLLPLDIYRLEVPTGFTTTVAHGLNGRWSPNGSFFGYTVPPGSQSCDEGLTIDAAVSHQRQFVFSNPVYDWAWSPDSTTVAVASYDVSAAHDTDGLYVITVPGGEQRRLIEGPVGNIDWSP